MVHISQATYVSGTTTKEAKYHLVDVCPLCKRAIAPAVINSVSFADSESHRFSVITCVCCACNKPFLHLFKTDESSSAGFRPLLVGPSSYRREEFSNLIVGVSPSFVEIYNQALQAEEAKLDQIAGIGYRKALEFLVKDYLIHAKPDDKYGIEKAFLGPCIENYVDNPQLKAVAERAIWLGNDHTHYTRKYSETDIEDLKRLVRLSVNWVNMMLETDEAIATIDKR